MEFRVFAVPAPKGLRGSGFGTLDVWIQGLGWVLRASPWAFVGKLAFLSRLLSRFENCKGFSGFGLCLLFKFGGGRKSIQQLFNDYP